MSTTSDTGLFVAVSNTSTKLCCLDSQGKPSYAWQENGQQAQGSVNWLRNGKAFLTTQGGNVAVHVLEALKDKPPVILSLPAGPLLTRVGGDGKSLILVQTSVPGTVHVYDLQALLGSTGGSVPAKPPVAFQDHNHPILALAASVATTHVASSNAAGNVYLHDAGSGGRSTLGQLQGGPALMTPKRCLAFSQTNKPLRLAAGADDGQVLVWQVTPAMLGPVVMHTKLRGRVMGVGFAAYNRSPAAVLLGCSESGQLSVADMRSFPNVQASFSVELNVSVSCMAVREDGQLAAVGTKDGRVGLIRVDELLTHKQNLTKTGLIKVFDLGTHLDVVDLAFQRIREPRESRESGIRDSRESATPSTSTQQNLDSTPQDQQPPDFTPDGSMANGFPRPGMAPFATPATATAPGTAAGPGGGGGGPGGGGQRANGQMPGMPPGGGAAAASTAPAARPAAGAVASQLNTNGTAGVGTASAPSGLTHVQAQQQQGGRPVGVPALVIPGAGGGAAAAGVVVPGHRRPSDVGGGGGVAAAGSVTVEDAGTGGAEAGSSVASPGGRGGGGIPSPVASPSRPRSPRGTLSSTGGGFVTARPPLVSSGGDALASSSGLRSYLDDFRQEVRDLVRGLQADMVRQSVAMEMAHRGDLAVLQQENRQLREEVQRLSKQLDTALRFGLLGQQRAPW